MTDPRTLPSYSERLWSEEVGLADPDALDLQPALAYRFGSGRVRTDRLATGLYAPAPDVAEEP